MGTRDGLTITGASVRVSRVPVADRIALAFGGMTHRACVLVELHTGGGLVGYGESWVNYPAWAFAERQHTLEEGVLPLVIGRTAAEPFRLYDELLALLEPLGRQWGAPGPIRQALSAVDIAAWDLRARADGRVLTEVLAAALREMGVDATPRARVPVYASSLGPYGVAADARGCARAGYQAVKVRVGFDPVLDRSNVATAREVLGADVALYADANQAWLPAQAREACGWLKDYGVRWIEEPLRGGDPGQLADLAADVGMGVAAGENVYGLDAFRHLMDLSAVSVIQPDVTKNGGLSETMRVVAEAAARGIEVVPHFYGAGVGLLATAHLAAATQVISHMEYDVRENPFRDGTLANPPRVKGGSLLLAGEAGLGDVVLAHPADVRS